MEPIAKNISWEARGSQTRISDENSISKILQNRYNSFKNWGEKIQLINIKLN